MAKRLLDVIMLWSFALFYGAGACITILLIVWKNGLKAFRKVERKRPTDLDDPALGTHGFLQHENVKIHYVASGPEDKPLMLFVHGFPEFWYSWRHQIREFQKDYRCVAIDQRGYGESDKPTGIEAYKVTELMDDLRHVINALGYKTCTLVGHDWGGAVTWAFARHFPDMVDKLIVMNAPPSKVFREILKSNKKQFKMSWYMLFFQLPYLPELFLGVNDGNVFDMFTSKETFVNPLSKEEIEPYKYTFSTLGSWTAPVNYYRASLQLDPVKYDTDYSVPILLIWGMQDMALCSDIPDAVEKCSSSITVKKIPESGHFVQMDAPDTVNGMMREWL